MINKYCNKYLLIGEIRRLIGVVLSRRCILLGSIGLTGTSFSFYLSNFWGIVHPFLIFKNECILWKPEHWFLSQQSVQRLFEVFYLLKDLLSFATIQLHWISTIYLILIFYKHVGFFIISNPSFITSPEPLNFVWTLLLNW